MLKPKLKNVILYLLAKYIAFAVLLAFLDNRFKSIVLENSINDHELFQNSFYYILEVSLFILLMTLLLTAPIYFALNAKKGSMVILFIVLTFIVEYYLYTDGASSDPIPGLYNEAISIAFIVLFFYKTIVVKFQNPQQAI